MKRLPLVVAALLAAACQVTPPAAVKPGPATPAGSSAPTKPIATLGNGTSPVAPATGTALGTGADAATGVPDLPGTGSAAAAPASTGVTVTGAVRVPAGIVAAGGMNLVAAGGGNYALLAVEERAVAGARVFLADAAGNAIPGIAGVTTDATGAYTIPDVPPDFTFVVAAEVDLEGGKKATFQTLTKPGKLGATASLDASTTLVAANLLEGVSGSDLGDFNPAAFKTCAETTAKNLATEQLPDFSDRASVRAKIQALVETVGELKTSVDAMRTELTAVKKTLADLQAELERAKAARPPLPPPGVRPSGAPSDLPPPNGAPSDRPPVANAVPGTACAIPGDKSHWFEVPFPEKIATVEFKVPQPGQPPETWPTAGTGKKDVTYSTRVTEGCVYHVVYKDAAGAVLGVVEGFAIAVGSPDKVVLPAPTRVPGQATPTAQPSAMASSTAPACTAPVAHRITITTTGAALIKFAVPNAGGGPGQIVAEAKASTLGAFELSIPQGCPHLVAIFDAAGTVKATLPNYVIPAGSPREIKIPI